MQDNLCLYFNGAFPLCIIDKNGKKAWFRAIFCSVALGQQPIVALEQQLF